MLDELAPYLVKGPGAAFLIALCVMLAGRHRPGAAALGIGLGVATAQGLLYGWPELPVLGQFPDPSTEQRLVVGYVALGLLGLVAARRTPIGWSARGLACFLLTPWLLWNVMKRMEVQAALAEALPLGIALFASWSAATFAARRRPGPGVPGGLLAASCLGAGALLFGASVTLAEQAGVLCGAIAAAGLLALGRPEGRLAEGAAGPAAAVLGVLAIAGWRLAELSPPEAALLGLAPLGALLGLLSKGRAATALAIAGPAIPAAIALAVSYLLQPADPYAGYG